ncbi:MAG: glycosyltransferase family 9 protein [Candidatus Eiseniibacteriota bacterium]
MERRNAHPLADGLARFLRPGRSNASGARELGAGAATGSRVRRILIVKTHDQLGDFLVATPAIAALRTRFPDATIGLVVRDYLAPLARHVPGVDRLWILPRGGPAGVGAIVATLASIAGFRPDLAFVMNSVSRSKTADLIAALSGARAIIGRSRVGAGPLDAGPEPTLDALYDLDLPLEARSAHQVDRLLDLVRWTGASAASPRMLFVLDESERAAGRRMLANLAQEASGRGALAKRVGIHPAAANALKCWPVESFVALGVALASDSGAGHGGGTDLFVLDTPKEPGPAHDVAQGLRARDVRAAIVPPLPLAEFAGVLSALDLLVCNDSGVMHLAAAIGIPTVSIHSLGDPKEWAPQSERAIALRGEPIARVSVDDVLAAARTLLR